MLDPDNALPTPNPDALGEWWKNHRSRFQSNERYFLGEPPAPAGCKAGWSFSTQRMRSRAAIHLLLLKHDVRLRNSQAPARKHS